MSALDDMFEQIKDQPVPGGCDRCNAYQSIETVKPGVYKMTVHHDDSCPFMRSREAGSN